MYERLTDNTFLQYAMKHYDNPQCHTLEEFEDDLKRFLYLKKLFTRYRLAGELRERLIVNHIVVLYNLFGPATTKMLFHKIDEEYWPYLVTVLIFLNRMPEALPEYGIRLSDFMPDIGLVDALRKL
jgi:hypothetical protein